ncbi:F-box protein At5g65850-like [Bidens hawaiensis]|uniref:F-box protein At5g65850-like n=1 Tax=Bidens hawaiensis TaxID=980011 RepID=UPI00404B921B
MAEDIPFDIQIEVIKLLPLKSLIQFRSVSKPWKSLIESSDFITDYTDRCRHQPHHLLIRYQNNNLSSDDVYVSIADNDSFPQNKYSPYVPLSVNRLRNSRVLGTSRGVFCLLGSYRKLDGSREAVFWNPSIRKSVAVVVPGDIAFSYATGFGVCPATSEPKLVKINKRVTWQVEVFSLTWQVWRISPCNPPDKLVEFKPCSQSHVDRFIYWLGVTSDAGIIIISFDLLSEEFGEIRLPDALAFQDLLMLDLSNLSDSLVVLRRCIMTPKYEVWKMENGVSKSFMRLYTINEPNELLHIPSFPLEFRRNGELMMGVDADDDGEDARLVVYQPLSGDINGLGFKGRSYSLHVSSYTESLLLLDQ